MYYSFNSHTSLLLWLLTHHWVGPVWPGRAGAEGCWIPDHRGGWTGEPPPEQNPAGKAPAAGLAAPAPRKGAAWTSHLRETPNGERMCEAKQFKRGFFILWFLELMAVLFLHWTISCLCDWASRFVTLDLDRTTEAEFISRSMNHFQLETDICCHDVTSPVCCSSPFSIRNSLLTSVFSLTFPEPYHSPPVHQMPSDFCRHFSNHLIPLLSAHLPHTCFLFPDGTTTGCLALIP